MFSLWSCVLILLASLYLSSAKLTQIRVDDQAPDSLTGAQVVYTPINQWLPNATCTGCPHPDTSRANKGTWKSSIYQFHASPPSASISFTGSSVSVYCIVPSFQNVSIQSHMTFFLDGRLVNQYSPITSNKDDYIYQALVYTSGAIATGNHTLTIQNGLPDGKVYLMNLDSITFLTDLPEQPVSTPSNSSNSSKVKALTGVLITVCILFAITLAYLLYRLYVTRKRLGSPSRVDMENLRASSTRTGRPFVPRWLTRYLSSNTSNRSFTFNRSRFAAGRLGPQEEGVKSFTPLDLTADGRRQRQPDPTPTEEVLSETQSRSRWAFIMSWRDRAVQEAHIPTLPPTSYAPTTNSSGPKVKSQTVGRKPPKGRQKQNDPGTARPQTRRTFAIVNA